MATNFVVAPLLPGDSTFSDGVYTNDVEIYGSLIVNGSFTGTDTTFDTLNIVGTTASVNATTGSLIVAGGVGVGGSLSLGSGLRVKEGLAASKQGTATLVSGLSTVTNTSVTANSRIFLTTQSTTQPTSTGALFVTARVPATDFVVRSTNSFDTSTFAYEIFEPTT